MISFKVSLGPVTEGLLLQYHTETQGSRITYKESQTWESNRQATNPGHPTPTPTSKLLSYSLHLQKGLVVNEEGDVFSKSLLVRVWGDVSKVPEFGCSAFN